MSLIKVAFISPSRIATFLAPSIPGVILTKSGNPLKLLMSKNSGPLSTRRILQKATASTFANSVNNIRNGKIADATRLGSAYLDEFTGHSMQFGLQAVDAGYKKKGIAGKVIRHIVDETIDKDGKYNIANIEKYLKRGKKVDNAINHIKKYPYELVPAAGMGTYQGLKSYNKEQDVTKKNKAALKGTLKGFAEGVAIGKTLKIGAGVAQKKYTSKLGKVHDIYFEDNYWKKNLESANKGLYRGVGKAGSYLFTAAPEKRMARMKSAAARDKLINGRQGFIKGFVKNMFSKSGRKTNEENFNDYATKIKDKFRSVDYLKQKYGDTLQEHKKNKLKTFLKHVAGFHGDNEWKNPLD